jgi:hypothetical protein
MFLSQIIGLGQKAGYSEEENSFRTSFSGWDYPYRGSPSEKTRRSVEFSNNNSTFSLSKTDRDNLLVLLSIPVRVYLHELGHLIANSLLYTNGTSAISLHGLGLYGGFCKTTFKGRPIFSNLGKGLEGISSGTTSSVISAAGPLVDIVCLLALSAFSKKSKVVSRSQSMASYFLVAYAASALVADKNNCNGHDFCNIWARSGFLTYSAALGACVATHMYVHRQLSVGKKLCR